MSVKASVFTDWYFKLCTLAERKDIRLRPLEPSEAVSLEIRGALYESRLRAATERPHSGPELGGKSHGSASAAGTPRSRAVIN